MLELIFLYFWTYYYSFKFFGLLAENQMKQTIMDKLLIKMITYIPCILLDLYEYIKYQYQITTKPIVLYYYAENYC